MVPCREELMAKIHEAIARHEAFEELDRQRGLQ
jgi:hypothetical protein